jgi:sugar (pentulose or hexulose) kinase
VILTIDVGTSVTKAALWGADGLIGLATEALTTDHPAPRRSEQDPGRWWGSVVDACGGLAARTPGGHGAVEAVGCTGARQTFGLFDVGGHPLGPGILWSDLRAGAEAEELRRSTGSGPAGPSRPGVPVDGASMAAKLAWLAEHEGSRLAASTWVLAPRDLVVWRLTGEVATDPTMASSTGLYDFDGGVVEELAGPAGGRLAPVLPSDRVTGGLTGPASSALGLPAGTPVVIGAGDRPCEVLGTGATGSHPMVSWGTTANLSVPVRARPAEAPAGLLVSRGAVAGWLLEGGLSAAGSFVAWLGRLTGRTADELAGLAAGSPVGAHGVVATPWLEGARAPWWRDDAGAAFVGLATAHALPDLARAVFESVAWEVERCRRAVAADRDDVPPVTGWSVAGSGASIGVWLEVLTGVTGLPATARRSGQAASAGAALLAAAATGMDWGIDELDPVGLEVGPDTVAVERYAALSGRGAQVADAVLGLADDPGDPSDPNVRGTGRGEGP